MTDVQDPGSTRSTTSPGLSSVISGMAVAHGKSIVSNGKSIIEINVFPSKLQGSWVVDFGQCQYSGGPVN